MNPDLNELLILAQQKHPETKKFFAKLRKKAPKNLDQQVTEIHDAVFTKTECLNCANCCKTTGPLFLDKDIVRIAKSLKIKAADFERQYLRRDEEGDWVLQQLPCSFLATDNSCLIYEVRPKACSQFPHTNHGKFKNLTPLTLKNVAICPAAFTIVEKLKERLEKR